MMIVSTEYLEGKQIFMFVQDFLAKLREVIPLSSHTFVAVEMAILSLLSEELTVLKTFSHVSHRKTTHSLALIKFIELSTRAPLNSSC